MFKYYRALRKEIQLLNQERCAQQDEIEILKAKLANAEWKQSYYLEALTSCFANSFAIVPMHDAPTDGSLITVPLQAAYISYSPNPKRRKDKSGATGRWLLFRDGKSTGLKLEPKYFIKLIGETHNG